MRDVRSPIAFVLKNISAIGRLAGLLNHFTFNYAYGCFGLYRLKRSSRYILTLEGNKFRGVVHWCVITRSVLRTPRGSPRAGKIKLAKCALCSTLARLYGHFIMCPSRKLFIE